MSRRTTLSHRNTLKRRSTFKQNYSHIDFLRNHPLLRYSYRFYEKLENELKENSLVKMSLGVGDEVETVVDIWRKKFKENVSLDTNPKKIFDYYYNSRVVVIEEISTSFYELLYLKR